MAAGTVGLTEGPWEQGVTEMYAPDRDEEREVWWKMHNQKLYSIYTQMLLGRSNQGGTDGWDM
jgi:hypothetical protein